MKLMGYYIFFIRSKLKCGFGDFKAPWEVWRADVPHPGVFGTQQWPWTSPGSRCPSKESWDVHPAWCWPHAGGPCSAFIPAAPSSHLPFSVQSLFGHLALKTRGCNVMGDPPRDCGVCSGKPTRPQIGVQQEIVLGVILDVAPALISEAHQPPEEQETFPGCPLGQEDEGTAAPACRVGCYHCTQGQIQLLCRSTKCREEINKVGRSGQENWRGTLDNSMEW